MPRPELSILVLVLASLSVGELDREARLECEQRLAALGYWSGELDSALVAFRKVEGRPLHGPASAADLEALRSAQRPLPLEGGPAHLEVDLDRQVLFVVGEGGAVDRVLPVSTGNACTFTEGGRTRRAVTPPGRYRVERKLKGWRRSPLGRLYSPLYIHGGIAIHGSKEVPPHRASHGCIRVPLFAADALYERTPVGTPVLVHGACEQAWRRPQRISLAATIHAAIRSATLRASADGRNQAHRTARRPGNARGGKTEGAASCPCGLQQGLHVDFSRGSLV